MNNIAIILISVVASLIALTVHEYAHGYAAYKLGDNTAKLMGRLTLNPLHHLDPMGVLCMVLFHFGWAKPVPINPYYFKNPKKGFAITALAGPLINLIMGFFSAMLYVLSLKLLPMNTVFIYIIVFFQYFSLINIGLGVFNLIPIPPFDGSRILNTLLPDKIYFKIMKYEKKIYWGVIAWLLLGGYVYTALISIPFIRNSSVLSSILKIFSLSDLINNSISFISNSFAAFWSWIFF